MGGMGSHSLVVLVGILGVACSQQVSPGGNGANGGTSSGNSSLLPDGSAIPSNLDSGGGTDPAADAGICSTLRLTPQALYPEVMIAQDISGSMAGDRWRNTKAALVDVAKTFDSRFRLGLYFFPKLKAAVSNSCELGKLPAGQYVDVTPALGNGSKIKAALDQLDATPPYGGTPTAEALPVVRDYFVNHSAAPAGTPKYVILSTDGSPNCTPPSGDGDNSNDPVSQAATTTAITGLRDDKVTTYVVGYAIDSNLRSVMNGWAVAGGGSDKYVNVTNQQSLTTALTSIANAIVSCEYELDVTPSNPSYVRVQIDGKSLKFGDPNGWTLSTRHLTLQGTACSSLRDGQPHDLNVQVECDPVVIL